MQDDICYEKFEKISYFLNKRKTVYLKSTSEVGNPRALKITSIDIPLP